MALSKEQIQQLFSFTEKKFVRWYDLQAELVDHLANKIEAEMAADVSLTFERALGNVYAGFGIFGFAEIVREREKTLTKSNNKLMWNAVKAEFSWPNLIRSICILLIIYTIVFTLGLKAMLVIYVILYLTDIAINSKNFYHWRAFEPKKSGRGIKKNLLMLKTLPSFNLLPFFYFQFLLSQFYRVFDSSIHYSDAQKLFLTGFLFLGTILFLASSKISNSVLQKAKIMYPEAFA